MKKMEPSKSARGGNRGGCGGGYERTSDSYDYDRMRRLRADYDKLDPKWRETFLEGLSKWEQKAVVDRRIEIRP